MTDTAFEPGHLFFRPGDPGERAYLLSAGEVELLAGPADAGRRVAVFGPGDVFGEMSLVEERPHRMTARATAGGRAAALTRDEFEQQLLHDPARCRAYLISLFERLRELSGGSHWAASPAAPPARVTIYPLTSTAGHGVPDGGVAVPRFPFRIGRASTHPVLGRNDLDLADGLPYIVSRSHCQLELGPDGHAQVRDRGSHLGTWVNENHIGGPGDSSVAPLRPGENTLFLGGHHSPFRYLVVVEPAA